MLNSIGVKEAKHPVIIQLEGEPLAMRKISIQKEISDKLGKKKIAAADAKAQISSRLANEELNIADTQQKALSSLVKMNIPVKKTFKNLFNGIAVDATEAQIEAIRSLPNVKAVYQDKEVYALLSSSVPFINATDVWRMQVNGTNITGLNVKVAIIDTGIDYTHPDLGNCTQSQFLAGNCSRVVGGYDFVNNDMNPMDDHGHGTHVAGIVAANGTLKGVAPDAKLLAYKVLGSTGSGLESNVIAGIERAINDSADIISMSLGGSGDPDDVVSQAVDTAVEAGAVVVVAAGNSGPSNQTIDSPGTARRAITVGATDVPWDIIESFSSRGPVIWANGTLLKPDILAPGYYINSTVPRSGCTYCSSSGYAQLSGTSMATPHVSGAAALLLQEHPDWNPDQVRSALMNGAKKSLWQQYTLFERGAGRLNALASANYNATCIITPQSIGFGISDLSASEWNSTKNMTLVNYGSLPVSYNLTVDSSYTGISFTYPGNITIDAYSSHSFNFTVSINNSAASFRHYFGNLLLNSSMNNITVPFWFLKESLQIFVEQNTTRKNTDIWFKAFGDLSSLDVSVGSAAINATKRPDGNWRATHSAGDGQSGNLMLNATARNVLNSTITGNVSFFVDKTPPQLMLNLSVNGSNASINISADENISPAWSHEVLIDEGNESINQNLANAIVADGLYVFYVEEDKRTGFANYTYNLKYRMYNSSEGEFEAPMTAANCRQDFGSLEQEIDRDYLGYTVVYSSQPQVLKDRSGKIYAVLPYYSNNNFCGVSRVSIRSNASGTWEKKDVYSVDRCTGNQTLCLDPSIHHDLWCDTEKEPLNVRAVIDQNDRIHIFWYEFVNSTKIINFTGQVITTYVQNVQNSNQTLNIYDVFYEVVDTNGTVLTNKTTIGGATNLSSFALYDISIDFGGNIYAALMNTLSFLNVTDPLNSTLQITTNTTYLVVINATSGNRTSFKLSDFEQSVKMDTDSEGRVYLTFNNDTTNGSIYCGVFNFTSNRTDVSNRIKPSGGTANIDNTLFIDADDNVNVLYQAYYQPPDGWYSALLNHSRFSKAGNYWTRNRFNFESENLTEYLLPASQFLTSTPRKIIADSEGSLHAVWDSDQYYPTNSLGLSELILSVFYKTLGNSPYVKITEPNGTERVLNMTGMGTGWNATFNCTHGGTHILYSRISDYAGNSNHTKAAFSCNVTVPPGNSKPDAPVWAYPPNLSTKSSSGLSLRWENASDADDNPVAYILLLDDNPDFSSPVILENLGVSNERNITAQDDLQNGTEYYFKVYANDGYQDGNETSGSFNLSATPEWCGDGACSAQESCSSCSLDCGTCSPPPANNPPSSGGPIGGTPVIARNKTNETQKNFTILDQTVWGNAGNKSGAGNTMPSESETKQKAKEKINEIRPNIEPENARATSLLKEAEAAFDAGDYEKAYSKAVEAERSMNENAGADGEKISNQWANVIVIAAILVIITVASSLAVLKLRRNRMGVYRPD